MTAVDLNELSTNARGGTELMAERLVASLPPELLAKFQIIPTRVRVLDPNRIRLLWCHELPVGPEAQHLANGGWRRYHRIIFVSHSQMQSVCGTFHIPYSHCECDAECDCPDPGASKNRLQGVRMGYWSMPDRGLSILVPVFAELAKKYADIALDVFSSFNLYGWAQHDVRFEPLFEQCRAHPSYRISWCCGERGTSSEPAGCPHTGISLHLARELLSCVNGGDVGRHPLRTSQFWRTVRNCRQFHDHVPIPGRHA